MTDKKNNREESFESTDNRAQKPKKPEKTPSEASKSTSTPDQKQESSEADKPAPKTSATSDKGQPISKSSSENTLQKTSVTSNNDDESSSKGTTSQSAEGNSTEKKTSHKLSEKTRATSSDDEGKEDHLSSDEDDHDSHDEDIPMKDFDEMNLDALAEELERLIKAHPVKKIRSHVREIKSEFDLKFGHEREQKKETFLESGGNIIDFAYSTPTEKKFNRLYFDYKEKRDNYYKQVRKNLQENLERRLVIIEELKAMTGVGNDMNANYQKFKSLQDRWRKAGPVPRNDYKDTWKTYHHHVEHFYEFLHLDREFREMDYKHNLEQKLKMIARAEELAEDTNVNRAFRELQNLHRMWKEDVGPVAQEYREPIWEKFSTATKKIHENRKAFFAELDKEREKNRAVKETIIEKVESLENKAIKSHHQAQERIKTFKDLRNQFFEAGKVPKKHNQEVWNAFKKASRSFNHKKNEFYKNRKQQQKENLAKKRELIKIAEEHQDSEDFETVTPLMKKIQSDWKKIGFVQRSKSDKIWKRFKAACNHYFDRLHARQDEKNKAALETFSKKKALLEETKSMTLSGNREEDLPIIKEKIERWKNLGRVPKNKKYIESKFNKTLDKLFKTLDVNRKEAEMLKYENKLQRLENADNDKKIRDEAAFLRKRIDQTSDEIRQLETNLEFFNNADEDNPLMKDAFKNIEKHKQQLKIWKAKLSKLREL